MAADIAVRAGDGAVDTAADAVGGAAVDAAWFEAGVEAGAEAGDAGVAGVVACPQITPQNAALAKIHLILPFYRPHARNSEYHHVNRTNSIGYTT